MKTPLRLRLALVLLLFAVVALPGALHAQTLLDPSFEQTPASLTISNGGFGWTPNDANSARIYDNTYGYGLTNSGNQWLFLSSIGRDSQTIASGFTLGQAYQFTVNATDLEGGTIPHLRLSVSGGATATQLFNLPMRTGAWNTALPFGTYVLYFTPTTNNPITITVESQGYPMAIDNVSVTVAPEPGTWAMIGAGVLTLVGVRRVRRNKAAAVA